LSKRPFGRTGRQLPVVGQGTWNMEQDDRASCVEALRAGLDLGLTHVDTAELYGEGVVEEIVADAISGRRDEVELVSKVLPWNASRKGTIAACERSLRRLRTDRLDGYLIHWPGEHPVADTIAAFEELALAGKIRWWGVSNFDETEMAEVEHLAPGRCACNQVLYHLKERAIEHALVPWCEANGVAVVAYSPFGSGDFPSPRSAGGKVLAEIGKARGASARQVALAWLQRRPGTFTIPKASRVEHVKDNARASSLVLTAQEVDRIDRAFPLGPRRPGVPSI
jgi:diketogulonate reductase-like aldo/keto reductase